ADRRPADLVAGCRLPAGDPAGPARGPGYRLVELAGPAVGQLAGEVAGRRPARARCRRLRLARRPVQLGATTVDHRRRSRSSRLTIGRTLSAVPPSATTPIPRSTETRPCFA